MIDYKARIESDIVEYGQFLQAVLGSPPWTYTIGNADKGLPELIMCGIDPRSAMGILNDIGTRMRTGGVPLEPGTFIHEVANMPMRIDAVHPSWIPELMCQSVYREERLGRDGEALRALQITWPDRAGLFPGEPGHDVGMLKAQMDLSKPKPLDD